MARTGPSKASVIRAIVVVVGLILTAIGVRFWLAPGIAARDFGVGRGAYPTALHDVIAVRDVWLGLLAVALAVLSEWRALALWLGLGTLVCFIDAGIATASGAGALNIGFHILSGLVMVLLTAVAWQLSEVRRTR